MATFFGFTDPFEDLLDMQRQMESLMNVLGTTTTPVPRLTTGGGPTTTTGDVCGRGLTTTAGGGVGKRGWSPSLDVCDTEKSLVIHAELPGCNKEDIKLSIDNNRLVLQGKKKAHKKEKGENWVRRERFRGSFYRSMPLPRNVDVQNIEANYDNGVLEIVVPKSQELAKRQTIDIKSAQGLKTQQQPQQEQQPLLQQQDRVQPRETTTLPQTTEEMKKPQEEQRVDEGVPQPPQPPQLQEQKFEQQPKQEQFGQEEKVQPGWEQQQPLQQQQQEEKQNIDIKFQGEQQTELKDQQQAKLQEGSQSSIFIQGGESGQESLSQEREKGSVQAM